MIDVFIPLKGFLRIEKLCTDNTVFRLHYRITVILLVTSMLLVTSKQLFGEPIHCIGNSEKEAVYKEAVNNFCWMYGTYSVPEYFNGIAGKDFAYAGVGPDTGERVDILYYQWVFVVLMLQAIMFYLPHYFWKIWENGRVKALTNNLDGPSVPAEWASGRKAELVAYLTHSKLFAHNLYAVRFVLCEFLNLANVIFQIYFVNWFLGGSFLTYGSAVAALGRGNARTDLTAADPMTRLFPKLAKCEFFSYGNSGSIQHRDFLCILPINVINEKIYIVLWFWFVLLALVSGLKVVQTVAVLACARLRSLMLLAQLRYVKRRQVLHVVENFSFGDWFVLHQLGNNLNPIVYKELLVELAEHLHTRTVIM